MPRSPVIVWFRRDLRVADNPALIEAGLRDQPVLPVYILDEQAPRPFGPVARWWLHHSLKALSRDSASLGAPLVTCRGRTAETLLRLCEESGAHTVLWNRSYDPLETSADHRIAKALVARGIHVETFNGSLLIEPKAICTLSGQPFRVFAHFWRRYLASADPPQPHPRPRRLIKVDQMESSDITDLKLLRPGADRVAPAWTPGGDAAIARLADFLSTRLNPYCASRDRPYQDGTSRLSPHLAFGELSPRQLWHAARLCGADPAEGFLRQLGWREFCHHSLHHFADLAEQPQRRAFRDFAWSQNEAHWGAWIAGCTGYPIVDAGMRALWEAGWIHNRMRMIVASFLVKDLLIAWQRGAAWFWDTLVDADVANNASGWQWVAGSGFDFAPYVRIFNPVLQGEKFDPQGHYVRRWVPELNKLPPPYIHRPWDAPREILDRAGVVLGRTYPHRIVDHAECRRRTLETYRQTR